MPSVLLSLMPKQQEEKVHCSDCFPECSFPLFRFSFLFRARHRSAPRGRNVTWETPTGLPDLSPLSPFPKRLHALLSDSAAFSSFSQQHTKHTHTAGHMCSCKWRLAASPHLLLVCFTCGAFSRREERETLRRGEEEGQWGRKSSRIQYFMCSVKKKVLLFRRITWNFRKSHHACTLQI